MRPIFIIAGLGFGDEGKGTITDALVRRYGLDTVIRYNGGAQCAHNVYTDDGKHHCFAQFGSGTLAGAKTFLSRHMLVNPCALINEEVALQKVDVKDAFEKLTIDGRALVTTPLHQLVNQLREKSRGTDRHGSCGMGIAETVIDSIERPDLCIRTADLCNFELEHKVALLRRALCLRYPQFYKNIEEFEMQPSVVKMRSLSEKCVICNPRQAREIILRGNSVFEGAQGIMLDEDFGYHPHTTWSRTTMANAVSLLRESGVEQTPIRVGVTRTFLTRHGPGKFPTEHAKYLPLIHDDDNKTGEWQGAFRAGLISKGILKKAMWYNGGIDALAVTHCDKTIDAVTADWISDHTDVPWLIKSSGKTFAFKEFNLDCEKLNSLDFLPKTS